MKKIMDELCPRKILLAPGSGSFSIPEAICIKIGGFDSVVSFSSFDVYVMPLLCRESQPYCLDYAEEDRSEFQKKLFKPNASKRACESDFDMAHLYIRMHTAKAKKHCIVAFIDCGKLQEIDALVARLCETAEWLSVSDQCPIFYVYYYGKRDRGLGRVEADALVLENIKRKMNRAIKSCVVYNEDMDVFFTNTLPAKPEKSKKFVINNKQNEFKFNPG
jgi:hypothetical protein